MENEFKVTDYLTNEVIDRIKAISTLDNSIDDVDCLYDLTVYIWNAFVWNETKEGFNYWAELTMDLEDKLEKENVEE
jgi:hypothetical protein